LVVFVRVSQMKSKDDFYLACMKGHP